MKRSNFSIGDSNTLSTTVMTLVTFLVFTIISVYPIEFWKKTPYFVPTLLSIYLFDNILLCPSAENSFRSVPSPKELSSDKFTVSQSAIVIALLMFSYGTTWIVNTLLGNRTASLLTYILRVFFFVVILVQTLLTLVTFRLVLVEHELSSS